MHCYYYFHFNDTLILAFFIHMFIKYLLCDSGGIILNNDRPASVHADNMHQPINFTPQTNNSTHSPTSYSLNTTLDKCSPNEISENQSLIEESTFRGNENKVSKLDICSCSLCVKQYQDYSLTWYLSNSYISS